MVPFDQILSTLGSIQPNTAHPIKVILSATHNVKNRRRDRIRVLLGVKESARNWRSAVCLSVIFSCGNNLQLAASVCLSMFSTICLSVCVTLLGRACAVGDRLAIRCNLQQQPLSLTFSASTGPALHSTEVRL